MDDKTVKADLMVVQLDRARTALAEAKTIGETKKIMDMAHAAQIYARRQQLGEEAMAYALAIKIEAMRKLGEILQGNGIHRGGSKFREGILNDLGIDGKTSMVAQQLAAMPEEQFEQIKAGEISVHEASQLSKLDAPARARAIEKIADGATVKQAARFVAHEQKRAAPFPKGKYQVIYADPPWEYENSGYDNAAASLYPTMPLEDICALPVETLATSASVLFLWATNPLLPEALRVMAEWGFEYKTNIAWVKDRGRGMGWFLKSKHELLLIGVRPQTPQPAERPDSAQEFERGKVHSRKPQEFRQIIERMYPGSKIELFARIACEGWDLWGNENATT